MHRVAAASFLLAAIALAGCLGLSGPATLPDPPPRTDVEQGNERGLLTAAMPQAEHTFHLRAGHPWLTVGARPEPMPGPSAGGVRLTIDLPDGGSRETDGGLGISSPAAGFWRVTVTLEGAATGYVMCWFAESSDRPGPLPMMPFAC